MKRQRQLLFAPTNIGKYLDVLMPLWQLPFARIELVGADVLADAVQETAKQHCITIERGNQPGTTDQVDGERLIVFTETDGDTLAAMLLSCADLEAVTILAPITEQHCSCKPLFLVSIPKAGTHLLYELAEALGYSPGVELPEFPSGQTWYCLEYSNSHTVAQDFFVDTVRRAQFGNRHHPFPQTPTLFIYRHPLDILVSEAHYYQRDGKTVFAAYFEQLDFDARVARLMEDDWLLGSFRDRVGGFLPWLEFPNVISLSFEELIGAAGGGDEGAQLDLIWSLMLKLQAPGIDTDIAAKVFNRDSPTFREGQSGAYLNQLPPALIQRFATANADLLARFGYPADGTPGLPRDAAERRRQALRYSGIDFEEMPLTLESGYLGCNLVRYRKQMFAVPMAAGPLALEQLTPDVLAELPAASTTAELKSLLLLGKANLGERITTIAQLATVLRGDAPLSELQPPTPQPPELVGDYKGYNLIAWSGHYLGLWQALGPVDLLGDIEDIAQNHEIGAILISPSLAALRNEIESKTATQDIGKRLQQLQQHLESEVQAAATRHDSTQQQAEGLQRQIEDGGNRFEQLESTVAWWRDDVEANRRETERKLNDQQEQILSNIQHTNELAAKAILAEFNVGDLQINLQGVRAEMALNLTHVQGELQNLSQHGIILDQRADEAIRLFERLDEELATQLTRTSERADETDRLLNELLKFLDNARLESDTHRQALQQKILELFDITRTSNERADKAEQQTQELRDGFDAYRVQVAEERRVMEQYIRGLEQRADQTEQRADQAEQRADQAEQRAEAADRLVSEQYTVLMQADANASAEHARLHARLDELQQHNQMLARNVLVRAGGKIGRIFKIK